MKIWIYKDKTQQGPFTLEELEEMGITMETKVWFSGLPKWYPAGTVPELSQLFNKPRSQEPELPELPRVPADATFGECGECGDPVVDDDGASAGETQPETAALDPIAYPGQQPLPQPQYVPSQPVIEPLPTCPPAYIVWSVILMVLCCSPFAIASLITGIITVTRYNNGNFSSAEKFSEATTWLVMLGFALGPIVNIMMSFLSLML